MVGYDNFDFKDTIRDELLGHKAKMRNLTTSWVMICPELPATGLTQDMHDPTIQLQTMDILNSPAVCGGDDIGPKISTYHIVEAIRKVHSRGLLVIYKDSELDPPSMPIIDRLRPHKTRFHQLAGIFEHEGSLQGTYGVHEAIYIQQFGLKAPEDPYSGEPDDFTNILRLIHGDALTAERIRGVKSQQFRAARPYDRRDWLLGIPSWFHIHMNLLYTIIRTHWSADEHSRETPHSIQSDARAWDRTFGDRANPKYHVLEPLLAQSFTARVLALFYTELESEGLIIQHDQTSYDRVATIDSAMGKLLPESFESIVERVRRTGFTIEAWQGHGHKDVEFTTMCRFLQEVELFLTVRIAVKHGDIGLLRRLVDPLIVTFLGAAQWNYVYEMLFYRWLLSPACTEPLQRSILASGLVNWQGRATTWKATDLGLEHLNCNCKIEMKCYKNSTHNVDTIFNRVCLTNTWIRELRYKLEGRYGEYMPGTHSTASALEDMFSLGQKLFSEALARPRATIPPGGPLPPFESRDIWQIGVDSLDEKVERFNKKFTKQSVLTQGTYITNEVRAMK